MLRRAGLSVSRIASPAPVVPEWAFTEHVKRLGIKLVFDVGAHKGDYAKWLRAGGYEGRIISFEPVEEAFLLAFAAASSDPKWTVEHLGLGRSEGYKIINVGTATYTSSIRQIRDEFSSKFEVTQVRRTEPIKLTTLDRIYPRLAEPGETVMLKIDVQGYEDEVLTGGAGVLPQFAAIQLELSLRPVYAGERLMFEHVEFLQQRGFRLIDLANGFRDHTGELVQVDGLFVRD